MPVFIWLAAFQYIIILLMNLTDKSGEAITSIETITVASVDTEAADEELEAEFMDSLETKGAAPGVDSDGEEGGVQ
jgi:hypothetical protein